uniref:Uncharacterized protein n=1 Tax=Timema shepardi TaxID=629360 RepID=A0A7R9B1T2_TIMSH|nr:unnamed protein product [Timema shepardi]
MGPLNAFETSSTMCSEMAQELRFTLRCRGSTKPARKKGPRLPPDDPPGRFVTLGPYTQYGFMGKEPLA